MSTPHITFMTNKAEIDRVPAGSKARDQQILIIELEKKAKNEIKPVRNEV